MHEIERLCDLSKISSVVFSSVCGLEDDASKLSISEFKVETKDMADLAWKKLGNLWVTVILIFSCNKYHFNAEPLPTESYNGTFMHNVWEESKKMNDPDWKSKYEYYKQIQLVLNEELLAIQLTGNPMPCSYQLSGSAHFYYHYTNNFTAASYWFQKFNDSLKDLNQTWAGLQQADGSFGPCSQFWFQKIDSIEGAIGSYMDNNTLPQIPFYWLNQTLLTNITALTQYLESIYISDIVSTGVDNREEITSWFTFVTQVFCKYQDYINKNTAAFGWYISDQDVNEWLEWLDKMQNKYTAFWGAQYLFNGTVYGTDDISMTFHVVRYRLDAGKRINFIDKLMKWLYDMKYYPYPYGWGLNGGITNNSYLLYNSNHNNYDVVNLMAHSWNDTKNDTLKEMARIDINNMLQWTMNASFIYYDDNTTFMNCSGLQVYSVGDCYYFQIAFMRTIGYYQQQNEFWSNITFDNIGLCCQLKQSLAQYNFDTILTNIGCGAISAYNQQCPDSLCQ